jgi:hypothetical protein
MVRSNQVEAEGIDGMGIGDDEIAETEAPPIGFSNDLDLYRISVTGYLMPLTARFIPLKAPSKFYLLNQFRIERPRHHE